MYMHEYSKTWVDRHIDNEIVLHHVKRRNMFECCMVIGCCILEVLVRIRSDGIHPIPILK